MKCLGHERKKDYAVFSFWNILGDFFSSKLEAMWWHERLFKRKLYEDFAFASTGSDLVIAY